MANNSFKKNFRSIFFGFIKEYAYIPLTILGALFVFRCVLILGVVPTASMEPTYSAGSWFMGHRLVNAESCERGDIVLFNMGSEVYVKRVIGLPGEIITFAEGEVLVNGEPLAEDYLPVSVETTAPEDMYCVPEGCYFMMGDNRGNSYDSRYWPDPYVPFEDVVGSMFFAVPIPGWGA